MHTLLSPAELSRYFARIGYSGDTTASLTTLRGLHRAHLLSIPYENLDIHLGVPLTLDPERIFAKLVDERRGGWCYEMNGLFGHVLDSLGFDVRRVSGHRGARRARVAGARQPPRADRRARPSLDRGRRVR